MAAAKTTRSDEMELQYSPSRWSKRYRAEDILMKHVTFVEKASREAQRTIPCTLNISYGSTEKMKYDLFGTDLPKDAPVFVFIHGGYWQDLKKESSSYVAKPLYKKGFKVKIVGFDLCPQVNLPEIVTEIQLFVAYCIEYAKANASRGIYLAGHSSGAHLLASIFISYFESLSTEEKSLVKAVFLISGIYDLGPLIYTYINQPLKLDITDARKLSPMHQRLCLGTSVRFFVIVGENDSPAFKEQSDKFQRHLERFRNRSELMLIKEVDHFDIVENLTDDNYEIVKLIASFNEPPPVPQHFYM